MFPIGKTCQPLGLDQCRLLFALDLEALVVSTLQTRPTSGALVPLTDHGANQTSLPREDLQVAAAVPALDGVTLLTP